MRRGRRSSTGTTSYRPSAPFDASTTYYVQVQAVNADETTSAAGFAGIVHHPAAGALVDDFDGYASDAALQTAGFRNVGGDPIAATLSNVADGLGSSMLLTYAPGTNGYAGVTHTIAQN